MKNLVFYMMTVLIWGSTWFGIKLQLGVVDPMLSVAYRFGLAATLLLLWCRVRGISLQFSRSQHLFMALQGIFLFSLNYLLFYIAELYLTSGLAAVIFSTILFMNILNGAVFLKSRFDAMVFLGGVLGLLGIILVFRPEVTTLNMGNETIKGIGLCFAATYLASLGNILSARNQKNQVPIIQGNGFGMAYGALLMFALCLVTGKEFEISFSFSYLASLFYLAIFGSIVAFGCYLTLVGNIGADRAAYATLLFPIVALLISACFEDYTWSLSTTAGIAMILAGNLVILKKNSFRTISVPIRRFGKYLTTKRRSADGI